MERHIVEYEKYCKTCEYYLLVKETEDPCNECLTYPVNDDSRKPTMYKKKTETDKKADRRVTR